MIIKRQPPHMGQLYGGTWINYNPIPVMEENKRTEPPSNSYCVLGLMKCFFGENEVNLSLSKQAQVHGITPQKLVITLHVARISQ